MSTYTDLHIRRKENLTILRMPGNSNDGITPQRVILANPENIYSGTFKGKIEASSAKFTSVDIIDSMITGCTIVDATICCDGQVLKITDLTSDISEIKQRSINNELSVISALLSCQNLYDTIDAMSSLVDSELSNLSNDLSTYSNLLCTELSVCVDDRLSNLSTILVDGVDEKLE